MLGVDQTSQVLAPRLVAMKELQNDKKTNFSLPPFSFALSLSVKLDRSGHKGR